MKKTRAVYEPLFNHLGLKHFAYLRYYRDGHYMHLCENRAWVQARLESNVNIDTISMNTQRDFVTPGIQQFLFFGEPQNRLHKILHSLDVWNGCVIYNTTKDYIEGWGFASSVDDTEKLDLYINNSEIIKKFIMFYKNEMDDIINSKSQECLFFDPGLKDYLGTPKQTDAEQAHLHSFSDTVKIKKYVFSDDIYFTPKQFKCLQLLSRGLTSKSIGQILGISPRTVESHLLTLKTKFGVPYREDLIEFFLNHCKGFESVNDPLINPTSSPIKKIN